MASDPETSKPELRLSKAFEGCVVCFSNFNGKQKKEMKEELKKKVTQMGGKFKDGLTSGVTHLITTDWTTPKAIRARMDKKPILMLPTWLDVVCRQSEEILPATHPSFLAHRLPIFHGFNLCFSKVPLAKRTRIKQKVESNGGKYSPDLDPNVVTHLILGLADGEKYKKARELNSIKKVDYQWFVDSIKQGFPPIEEAYPPKSNYPSPESSFSSKRKSGDSFPNMSEFLSCKKNKSNLFNILRSTQNVIIKSEERQELDRSLVKADEFENILKDLGNVKQNGRKIPIPSSKLQPATIKSDKRNQKPERMSLTKIKSSQSSDKLTESLPVHWESST